MRFPTFDTARHLLLFYLSQQTRLPCGFIIRQVKIYPLPNGNGKHSRLMAYLLVMSTGRERFTWDVQVCSKPAAFAGNISSRCAPRIITTTGIDGRYTSFLVPGSAVVVGRLILVAC